MYQNVDVNWDVFNYNFRDNPRLKFEQLSYLLFCFEFNQPYGIFRYFNQPYIETVIIREGDDHIGFQAKYYDATVLLSAKKRELQDAIEGAKRTYSDINRIIFYINKEFAPSSTKDQEKPAYLVEIEECGASNGIKVEWRVKSNFEIMLFHPGMEAVRDFCFNPNKGINGYLSQINLHSKTIFQSINSDIPVKDTTIKITHPDLNLSPFYKSDIAYLIIHGESGTGKSGLMKDSFQLETDFPVFIFRATDFDVSSISEFSRKFGEYTFEEFLSVFDNEPQKLFIIDSAEKVFAMNYQDTFSTINNLLLQHGWKILITIRTAYKHNFINLVLRGPDYQEHEIKKLTAKQLNDLESTYEIQLPKDTKLRELICNLFYLKLYLKTAIEGSSLNDNVEIFVARIWHEFIRNGIARKNDLHIRRESKICDIALTNANTGISYYTPRFEDDLEAISALNESGIISFDESMNGYYITHDVYEELILKHIIQASFNRKLNADEFFVKIGNSLVVRKSFRLWLHDVLESKFAEVSEFIVDILNNAQVEYIWRDEVLIALMNEPDQQFLRTLDNVLSDNNYSLFFRAIFLLNTACRVVNLDFWKLVLTTKELESYNIYRCTKPTGAGWVFLFQYTNNHKANITFDAISITMLSETLNSWTSNNQEGVTTKNAGQVALYLYNLLKNGDYFYSRLDKSKLSIIISVILNSAQEIFPELAPIFEQIILKRTTDHRELYHDLCWQLLGEPINSHSLCKVSSDLVISLAMCLWLQQDNKEIFKHSISDVDRGFGLNPHVDHEYYPSSALQTPTFSLLQASYEKALGFIIDFFDITTKHYYNSSLNNDYGECSTFQVHLPDGRNIEQIVSSRLWQMYRGTSVAPNLLESILMALERWLYLWVPEVIEEEAVRVCSKLLQSHSAAITAIVVSIITAYPNKLFEVACILLHSKEILSFDISRFVSEQGVNFCRGLTPINEKFDHERISSNALPFRKKKFEDIILEYQIQQGEMTVEQFKERRVILYENIDRSFADLNSLDPNIRFAFYRMDLRKMKQTEEQFEHEGRIYSQLVSDLPDDLVIKQNHQEESSKEVYKHLELQLWCQARYESRKSDCEKYTKYESNPHEALEASLEIYNNNSGHTFFLERSIPIYVSAVLLRDFPTTLNSKEISKCTYILIRHVYMAITKNREYQIGDGIDVAISMLPKLIMANSKTNTISFRNPSILLLTLLLERGAQQKCAVKAFREEISIHNPDLSKCIIEAFVKLKPDYDKEVLCHNGISPIVFFRKNRRRIRNLFVQQTEAKKLPYENLSDHALQTLSMMFHADNEFSIDIILTSGSLLWGKLFSDRHNTGNYDDHRDYEHKNNYISWMAEYLLCSSPDVQYALIQRLASYVKESDNTNQLLCDIISCQDRLQKSESFWNLWCELFNIVEDLCSLKMESFKDMTHKFEYYGRGTDEIVTTFSLAFPWWAKNVKTWHTLKAENGLFFNKLAMHMGYHPCVLYSVARVLNTIGFEFLDQGINWLHTIIESNPHLELILLQVNTEYYIEEYMQRYILAHRNDIKRNPAMGKKVIGVLSFLVNRGSTCGFMLRENIT